MPESFGARLRQQREQQHISLGTIAEQTKIKLSLLEALERDDVSHWPAGIFRRAFIRAYAHAIGLEPDVVVREFLEFHPDPPEMVAPIPANAAAVDATAVSGGPPTRLRYLVASAVGSLSKLRARPQNGGSTSQQMVVETATVHGVPAKAPAPGETPKRVQEPAWPDLSAVALLCTRIGRVATTDELLPLLQDAAGILDAPGLVVWIWDPQTAELQPALAHGYSDKVLAQLPGLPRDANNATAAAFREAQMCVVGSTETVSGALVLPLITAGGCVGVLALELQKRSEEREAVRAVATIIAAQLAALIGAAGPAEAADRRLA